MTVEVVQWKWRVLRILLWISAIGAGVATGLFYLGLWLASFEFGERCSHGFVTGKGELQDIGGGDRLWPGEWCRFEGGTISSTPTWGGPVFFALLAATLVLGAAVVMEVGKPSRGGTAAEPS